MDTTVDRPVSAIDPFSHAFLRDPYPHHESLRETGPVVWLEQYGIWTMARHQEVRDALTDWQTYCSSAGVGLSDFRKEPPWRPPSIILEADPPLHTRTRAVLTRIMSPAAINSLRETFEREAEALVARLVEQGEFDGIADLAEAYPLKVFPDAVGHCRGRPREPAALRQHGVQLVRPPQRPVRNRDGQCRSGSRLDHVEVQPRRAGAGRIGHADF